ncbi:DUF4031 domain-containing protein [Cellulomonas carbonis]|uniref:DUF4031 domain-containing protein n=1 Tax=Cellulomonas carbonis T26 TaxID=947969 RepID=A0A0A0BP16_9CELL|nr:DUF4031 domain-containing protein [Cellulomonas carbonis]KGM09685.1 hypothetical protein N868_18455 [Cellulomonas carbonis T26]GGC05366.1 hypothetical protein GCM10010972_18150 [Cellulomonas carbonis]
MTVLLDPPLWPRHGRVWGHLVSDSTLDELHALADRAGIPRRAFDLDHYDVPAERYDDLVALGAQLVDSRELVRRLRASGLRVTARDRRAGRRAGPGTGPGTTNGGRLP